MPFGFSANSPSITMPIEDTDEYATNFFTSPSFFTTKYIAASAP